jgi:hypothetical protein
MKNTNDKPLRQRKPSARRVESLIAGHVASGNIDSDLRELALLSIECEMLRERLAYKTDCLGIAFNSINDHADHAWNLKCCVVLEKKASEKTTEHQEWEDECEMNDQVR